MPRPAGCERLALTTTDGTAIPWQATADGNVLLHHPHSTVPGTGYVDLIGAGARETESTAEVTVNGQIIENDLLKVTIGSDGAIASLFDKRAGREVFDGSGNQLRVFHDLPSAWEAWNMTDTSRLEGESVSEIELLQVIEAGPLRAAIEVRSRFGSSRITQRYLLRAGSARLDIHTVIEWQERRKLLRALFPLTVRSARATFETSFGAVERPTHRNTSWETAKFEVPAQRWADLSEPGYGVSLLNNGRYGHSALGGTMGISLLRSPMDPDPLADLGRHEFTYSVYPHLGEWHEGGTVNEAIDINSPLIGCLLENSIGQADQHWFEIEGLTLAALKRAEGSSDLILRLYDPYGRHGVARVTPRIPFERAALTNLLEDEIEPVTQEQGGALRVAYRPFQIVTLRLTPAAH